MKSQGFHHATGAHWRHPAAGDARGLALRKTPTSCRLFPGEAVGLLAYGTERPGFLRILSGLMAGHGANVDVFCVTPYIRFHEE